MQYQHDSLQEIHSTRPTLWAVDNPLILFIQSEGPVISSSIIVLIKVCCDMCMTKSNLNLIPSIFKRNPRPYLLQQPLWWKLRYTQGLSANTLTKRLT